MSGSYYSLLGVDPSASTEDVRSAYLALARVNHPDRTPPEQREQATKRFQELARDYVVLSDPTSREVYDRTLLAPASPDAPAGALVPFEPPPPRSSSSQPSRPVLPPRSYTSSAAESSFPGYRVAPGGYPRAQYPPTSRLPFSPPDLDVPAALNPFTGLASPLSSSSPSQHSNLPLQQSEPLEDALMALSLRDRDRHYLDTRYDRYRHGRPSDWEWIDDGRGGGPCKTARKEWGEVKREWNGNKVAISGKDEVSTCADGGIRWRSESTTVVTHSLHSLTTRTITDAAARTHTLVLSPSSRISVICLSRTTTARLHRTSTTTSTLTRTTTTATGRPTTRTTRPRRIFSTTVARRVRFTASITTITVTAPTTDTDIAIPYGYESPLFGRGEEIELERKVEKERIREGVV